MAVDEIRRCSGSQFDPAVVDALVAASARGELRLLPRTGMHAAPAAEIR
jgi:HD-GYP domain-containing protein (c-di-GMP phosphodiesterase class II)